MKRIGLFCLSLCLFFTFFVVVAVSAEVQRDFHGVDILQSVASTSDVNRAEVITAQEVCSPIFNNTAVASYDQMTSENGATREKVITAQGDRSLVFNAITANNPAVVGTI